MSRARREFLKQAGLFTLMAACNPDALLGPQKALAITPDFFGHMIQGEWVADNGSLYQPVTVYFGLLRLWDSRAVWWKMATDTNALPANLRYAESAGADVMFVFGEPPAEALAPGKSKMPTKGAWLAFVGQIARERIRYAELWNEPAEGYWDGTPEELAEYCRLAYPILSASGKTVLSPSLTSWDADPGYSFADRFLSAGGGEWCDEIAFHCYSRSPAALADGVASLRALLKRHRVSRPIRNTEYNIVPSDPTLRSAYIAQSLLIQASLGVVGAVWDPEPTVAANDYTDDTVRRVAQILLGASVGPITSANGVSRCLVSRDSHDTELSWTGNSFPATALRMAA